MADKTKVIYIVSDSHSGSTLLDLILGSHPLIQSVGEVRRIRTKSVSLESLLAYNLIDEVNSNKTLITYCSCGLPIDKCNFWSKVIEDYESKYVQSKKSQIEYEVESILSVAGKNILCDSSKNISRCKEYLKADYDTYIIHLLRDPRAVAFSNK